MMTATYSPEDNKLRLYPVARLDAETYARVKAAGFIWAPKQELFVAPAWSPSREDLLIDLCGEIGDEDTSLVDRAEERADRFEGYKESRAADADAAHKAVRSIADGIPFGQPILVGHHSERHARKDAERIENSMRKAVKMWETSKYWQSRAAGAIRHAKYKELPAVRARRIKGLESDLRKQQKNKAECESWVRRWTSMTDDAKWKKTAPDGTASVPSILERARYLANHGHLTVCTPADAPYGWTAWDVLRPDEERYKACPAWTPEQVQAKALEIYARSQAYADRWIAHLENRLAYERAMLAEAGGTIADQKAPEKGGAVRCWSFRGGWSYIQKVNKVSVTVLETYGSHDPDGTLRKFRRIMPLDKLTGVMTRAEVEAAREAGALKETGDGIGFYLLSEPPKPAPAPEDRDERAESIQAMRETLKAGVTVAVAPQLFPTPPDLCARMVQMARICDGDRILEPSAGTGNILRAIIAADVSTITTAVEVNQGLADGLRRAFGDRPRPPSVEVIAGDFLELNGSIGKYNVVLMNPPFERGADIAHIEHARAHLEDGGTLVAICANGPRQREKLMPLADYWEDLPAGTFKEAGTMVNAALLVIRT